MTLRSRLAIGLAVLLVAGLGAFGLVTYSLYAPTQYNELDSQLSSSVGFVALSLEQRAGLPPSGPSDHDGDRGGAGAQPDPGGPGAGAPPVALAPGSYAELLSASGTVVSRYQLVRRIGVPDLAAALRSSAGTAGRPGRHEFLTVGSTGSGPEWRVLVTGAPGAAGYRVVIAVPTTGITAALHHLVLVEAEVAGGLLVLLLAAAWLILWRGLLPLEHMAARSRSIAAGDLSRRVGSATGPTEVVELGTALDTMLADLEVAFAERDETEARLRQFLADASHELRTPLTSIQGFAELFRLATAEGAAATAGPAGGPGDGAVVDPATVARRIEDEARRMKRLVDDLLLLARLDQVSVKKSEHLDLAVVAADACAAAIASQPGRQITLDAKRPVEVTGDPEHVRQALANLLSNALTHTAESTPIEVTAATDGSSGVVSVRDHGPGLGAEGLAHAFDRFWRGDQARAGGGAGLGLSIVAAIAQEHGGTVVASDAPGGGACFELRLPLGAEPPEETAPSRRDF